MFEFVRVRLNCRDVKEKLTCWLHRKKNGRHTPSTDFDRLPELFVIGFRHLVKYAVCLDNSDDE
jgi:hypothetical protein